LPPSKWDGIYDATQEQSGCFERNSFFKKITGSEDSLFLNVFTKSLNPVKPFPVMVFLYGGGFQNGENDCHILFIDLTILTHNQFQGQVQQIYMVPTSY
jgi:cholinesterase